jgi:aspartyl-tRNA(Asn)/glutamyl-tRNA(Gln) amidotransferase subunit C
MSRLGPDEVLKAARLSRLSLSEAEAGLYAGQIGEVLKYVDKLNELDTTDVEPAPHALALKNVLREDAPRPSLPRDAALANAPEQEAGCFKVPPIIQEM